MTLNPGSRDSVVEHLQVELRNETKCFLPGSEEASAVGCSVSCPAECFCLGGRSGDFALAKVLHWILGSNIAFALPATPVRSTQGWNRKLLLAHELLQGESDPWGTASGPREP